MKKQDNNRKFETLKSLDSGKILSAIEQIDKVIKITSDVKIVLDNVIHEVFQIFQSDRAWLFFPCNPNVPSFEVAFESTTPSYPGAKSLNIDVPMTKDMADYCHQALRQVGEPGVDPPVGHEMTNDIAIHFNVESLMFMALQPQIGDPWMIGLHQCDHKRVWTDEEKELFKIIGRRITDCIGNMLYLNQLRESESKFRTLFENSNDGILLADAETKKFTMCNAKICEMLGFEALDLTQLSVHDIHPQKDLPNVFDTFEKQLKKEIRSSEHPVQRKDGSIFYANINSAPITMDGKQLLIGAFRDITERKKSEEALINSEHKWRNILVNIPQIGISLDSEAKISFANEHFLNLTGWNKQEVIGENWFDMFIPEHVREEVRIEFHKVMSQKDTLGFSTYENEIIDRNGNILNVGWSNVLTKDASGNILDVTCLGVDLSERRRSEQKLKDSETKYRTILKSALDGFWLTNTEGRLLEVNDAYCKMSGYHEDELLSMYISNLEAVENPQLVSEHMQKVKMKGQDRFESKHRRKDGTIYDVEVSIQFRPDKGGQCVCFLRDITNKKQAFEAIRKSHKKMKLAADSAHFGIWDLDLKRNRLEWDDWMFQLYGLNRGDFSGEYEAWQAGVHPDDLERSSKEVEQAIRGEKEFNTEFRIVRPDDTIRYIKAYAIVSRDNQGEPIQMIGINYDITEQKMTELALKESEEKFRLSFNASPDAVNINRLADGLYVDINSGFTQLTGYNRNDVIGKTSIEIDIWADPNDRKKLVQGLQKHGYYDNLEAKFRRKDSSLTTALMSARVISLRNTPHIISITRDITDRIKAEEAVRRSESKYRTLFDKSADAIFIVDKATGRYLDANKAAEDLTGRSLSQLKQVKTKDVTPIGSEQRLNKIQSAKKPYELGEVVYIRPDGSERIARLQTVPLDGDTVFGIAKDITERKKLQNQLNQAQKMEAVGRLAGGVAHDFNNMLSVIIGSADMAMENVDPRQPLYTDLEEIKKAGERSADLTRQLLAFARKQTVTLKELDLNTTVESMLKMLQRLIGEDIELSWMPCENVWPIKMDTSQVDQILANLCVNARDAIRDVGKITIETNNVVLDDTYCNDHLGFVPGEYVLLAISDNGCGMDAETSANVFEPFFTTKEPGKGTGLGLATVYGVVKQNNGFVNVYSEPGQGTTFTIYLHRYLKKTNQLSQKHSDQPVEGGHETILLVEDEPAILRMITKMLERLRYTVLPARSPGEAIKISQEYTGELNLLITDVIMPEMNGRDLARTILSSYPDIKRLFMSGYTANVIAHRGILDEGINFIHKPFSLESLGRKVRYIMDDEKE